MRRRLALPLLPAGLAVVVAASAMAGGSSSGTGTRPAGYTLPGDAVFPEGIARRPGTEQFFVSSTTDGTIFRGTLSSPAATAFAAPGAGGRITAVGLKADARGHLVVAGGATGKVFVLSTSDGSTTKVLDTKPGKAPTFLNDVAISGGYAYVTDSQRPILFRVRLGAGSVGRAEEFVRFTGTALKYGSGFNANGIVVGGGGAWAIVVQSGTGRLFRIGLRDRRVSRVDLGSATVKNGDGMLLAGRTLYVSRNAQERIVPVSLSADGRRGRVGGGVTGAQLQYPTTLALDGERLLAVNSQFDKRSAMAPPELPFGVATIRVPPAPKPPRG